MYKELLTGIFEEAGKTSPEEQDEYLQSLKPVLAEMRDGFMTQTVSVDYSTLDSQACYILRYFPLYSQLIKKVLAEVSTKTGTSFHISDNDTVRALFIGPGPCPEVAGLASFMKERNSKRYLTAHLYDKYDWEYARSILRKHILPTQSPGKWNLIEHKSNLLAADFVELINNETPSADFLIFQNCLNEITHSNSKAVEENIINIIRSLKENKLAILIDRRGYDEVLKLLQTIEKSIVANGIGEVLFSADDTPPRYDGVKVSHDDMPPLLYGTGKLFDNNSNGRQPTRYVNYIRSVIRKI